MTVRGEKEVASHWLVVVRLARAILLAAAADGWDAAKRRIGEAYRDDALECSPDRDAARRYITEIAALVRHDAAGGLDKEIPANARRRLGRRVVMRLLSAASASAAPTDAPHQCVQHVRSSSMPVHVPD